MSALRKQRYKVNIIIVFYKKQLLIIKTSKILNHRLINVELTDMFKVCVRISQSPEIKL